MLDNVQACRWEGQRNSMNLMIVFMIIEDQPCLFGASPNKFLRTMNRKKKSGRVMNTVSAAVITAVPGDPFQSIAL